MERTPLIAGNWKMNMRGDEAVALARVLRKRTGAISGVEKVVCPPTLFLRDVRRALEGSTYLVGAQNAHWEDKGAFTGEVSAMQLAGEVDYVILGHSERRQYFGETDETVNRRVRAVRAHSLKPIMCVGETLEQRQAGETERVLGRQTRAGLDGVTIDETFVIAYEPVWAIGTGLAADGATAQAAIALIRATVRDVAGDVADAVRILYGGSVTPENIAEFATEPDIDGALVGGASLNAGSFSEIIEATASVYA